VTTEIAGETPSTEERKMRMMGRLFLTLAAVFAMAVTAEAQGPGRGFGMGGFGGGGYLLAGNKSVQEELKLTPEQAEKASKLATDLRAKIREKLEEIDEDERREKAPAVFREINEEAKSAVKGILSTEQLARLEQISLQQRGLEAFADAHVQATLKLTDDQKSKLKEIEQGVHTQMTEAREGFQSDREGTMKKMATIRKEAHEKATALLTDDQKKSWKELTGAPFEIKFEGRRPGA
jgi:Spy/CpxP family protein refolding chaperone